MLKYFILSSIAVITVYAVIKGTPEYIRPCHKNEPDLVSCIKKSIAHISPYLAKGIKEIDLPPVEPFIMDQLSLQLTEGRNGYKITMKNIEVYGATNYEIQSLKLSENGKPFFVTVAMPKLTIDSVYTSSGVLLIIPASGGGQFHGIFEGLVGNMTGKFTSKAKGDETFIHIDALKVNLDIKKATMSISGAFNNNAILTQATNLFLRENGGEVLRAMQPQMQKKIAQEFAKIGNQIFKNVPVETFYID